ncbi:MAG: hypothetical protein J6X49_16175 [Victivallales bacterium]|nr:hypothetical protein [Victivallales bacterium]
MMEKEDELREFAGMCSKSLSDDVALRQEVEAELLDHLEDAYEEERQNATEEEALSNTFKRFGSPEEISGQLVENNAARLSRNARIRRAAKWLLVPLMVVGVLFCIDVRGILASVTLLKTMKPSWFEHNPGSNDHWSLGWDVNLKTRKLSEYEQSLFDYYYGKGDRLEILSRLYEAHRDDAMLCAFFALELSQPKAEMKEKLPEIIANGRRIDPTNALYDYLESLMLVRDGCELPPPSLNWLKPRKEDDEAVENYVIKDRGKLDKAIAIYRQGLSRGNLNTYGDGLWKRIQGMLKIRGDLLGGMQMIDFRARERLLFLGGLRRIARSVAAYSVILHKEGDNAKAVELLATCRTFLSQYFSTDNIHFMDIFSCTRISAEFLICAKRLGASDEIAAWQTIVDSEEERRAMMQQENRSYLDASGLISGMAQLFSTESTGVKEWTNERRLEAAAFDSASIVLACLCLLVVIALFGVDVLAMRIGGRRPFLFIMSQSLYKDLLIKGLLLPTLIYFVLTYFIAGKGGPWFVLQVIPFAYLCLLWPLFYGVCCNRAIKKWIHSIGAGSHEGFNASRSFNMLCLFVVLLLFFGCILRPIAELRERHYARKETLVIPWGDRETLEDRAVRKLQKRILEQMNVTK